MLLVGGHEHDPGRPGELGEQPAEHHPVEAAHADVEEHRLDRPPFRERPIEQPQRRGPVTGGEHLPDPVIRTQQVRQVLQGGLFIIDREDSKADHSSLPTANRECQRA